MSARAPKRVEVKRLLTPEQRDFFVEVADRQGISLGELLRRLIDQEYDRLLHVERSRPKELKSDPKTAPKTGSQWGPNERHIEGVFERLRVQYGNSFEDLVGEQYREFQQLIKARDGEGLRRFAEEQPWRRLA